MTALLDVNVLVALAWPNHLHHSAAKRWFDRGHLAGWATCPLTESGFVRVSCNVRIIRDAVAPAEAILVLRQMTQWAHHVFWPDTISIAWSDLVRRERLLGHRQITDAHLLAVALSHNGKLVTFDRAVAELVPASLEPDDVLLML